MVHILGKNDNAGKNTEEIQSLKVVCKNLHRIVTMLNDEVMMLKKELEELKASK